MKAKYMKSNHSTDEEIDEFRRSYGEGDR